MVHKARNASYVSGKDVSPMRNFQHKSGQDPKTPPRMQVAVNATTVSPSADKWKYNKMIMNDRESFNNLHFC